MNLSSKILNNYEQNEHKLLIILYLRSDANLMELKLSDKFTNIKWYIYLKK